MPYPPDLSKPLHELFAVPHNTVFIGFHRATDREKKVLYTNMAVLEDHLDKPMDSLICGPINENVVRFYWRQDTTPTIDSHSRLVILWKRSKAPFVFRYVTVSELYRLMNMPLPEVCSMEAFSELTVTMKMIQMIGLCGQAFHIGVMLVHFYASVVSLRSRLDE